MNEYRGIRMPTINNVMYGYCGLLCEFCKSKINGFCGGCDAYINVCMFARCAINREVKNCFNCKDFPCKLHINGFDWHTEEYGKIRWKVYSDILLNMFKSL